MDDAGAIWEPFWIQAGPKGSIWEQFKAILGALGDDFERFFGGYLDFQGVFAPSLCDFGPLFRSAPDAPARAGSSGSAFSHFQRFPGSGAIFDRFGCDLGSILVLFGSFFRYF